MLVVIGQQQVPTAEHVERQVAVLFIVAVEEPSLLRPVQRDVGVVKIQHDLARCALMRFEEEIHQQPIDLLIVAIDLNDSLRFAAPMQLPRLRNPGSRNGLKHLTIRRPAECRMAHTPSCPVREMLALSLSRKTLRLHRDNIWVVGGEVIRRLQMDSSLRRRLIEQVVRDLIGDDAGPLLSHGQCRATFLRCNLPQALLLPADPGDSSRQNARSSTAARNRSRH
jgi:hypothetical protein